MKKWYSCRFKESNFFQVQHKTKKCQVLEKLDSGDYNQSVPYDYLGDIRYGIALCNVKDKHIYMLGGRSSQTIYNTCLRFDLYRKRFQEL